jgi:hypothetical protein
MARRIYGTAPCRATEVVAATPLLDDRHRLPADNCDMAQQTFRFNGFLLRLAGALCLVLVTFNPSGYSFVHWAWQATPHMTPALVIAAIALLIAWAVFLTATKRSLGLVGVLLALAFFAALIWAIIDRGWLDPGNGRALEWIALIVIATILGIGMSWSFIRHGLSGQADVDEVERH